MEPASIRYKNPGAMWPGAVATQYGSNTYVTLNDGQGNKIAVFDTYRDGIAAMFGLWKKSYTGMTLQSAIDKWSGHNSPAAYARQLSTKSGVQLSDKITPELLASPKGLALLRAQANWEAGKTYPATDLDWSQGQAIAFGTLSPVPGKPPATKVVIKPVVSKAETCTGSRSITLLTHSRIVQEVNWQKLKHEWKTFALATTSTLVFFYDGIVANNLDYTPLIPEHYRPYAPFCVGLLMLGLRRYK